jgi:glutamate synthase (NADPH) small chain
MEQNELRQWEGQCIQEEPPECTAACPIHVDVRTFVGQVGQGRWDEAWKTLRKTMPLAGILGRICEAPCEDRCKRGQAGDAIRVGALERACVSTLAPAHAVMPLPSRGKKVVVVGSGLSGLTVVWDLARKGYELHIFEPADRLGGPLRNLDQNLLPTRIIEEEVAILDRLNVRIHFDITIDQPDFLQKLSVEFNAVYLGLDAAQDPAWPLDRDDQNRILVPSPAQTTSQENIFAGGAPRHKGGVSFIDQVAQGRWAATSIDRFLQKVSPTAGREKEGPYQTRLFTSLEDIDPLPAILMADPTAGYTANEAMAEAARCIQCECLECVKVCPYLEKFGGYPKKYAREIYNNESIVMGSRQANKLINSCSLCGLCERVCPEDFAMQDLCLTTRQNMVRRDKMPPSAHEFALLDMDFSTSERFSLVRHQPGKDRCAYAFFPGCQLSASAPGQVRQTYDHLIRNLSGGVGLILHCCGAPAAWAGRDDRYQSVLNTLKEFWTTLGRPQLILACSTCFKMFKEHWPEAGIVSLWEVMNQIDLPAGAASTESRAALRGQMVIHDPCTTRHEPDIQDSARRLIKRLGVTVEELKLGRDKTECCGFGGLMLGANPDLAKEVVRRRSAIHPDDYLAYCGMCRDNLAGVGKRVLHLLDLIWPLGDADPADRPRPGWSERQENRARLKENMLNDLWGEKTGTMEEHEKINLLLSTEIKVLLERRRILMEDLQKVIAHAESTGDRLVHPDTGHFRASFKPVNVTFWVEYSLSEDGVVIHNAYSHRMEVVGGGRL